MLNYRNLSLLILLLFGFGFSSLQAQEQDVSAETYERLIENAFKVDFRSYAINRLGLNEAEITAFTPLYMEYMDERADLADKRARLIEEHAEEMSESNSAENKGQETADFVENYWEVDINEMELRKDYFDRMEDAISYEKAMAFFLLEEDLARSLSRVQLQRVVPAVSIIDLPAEGMGSTDPNRRNNKNGQEKSYLDFKIDGEVALDHEFTQRGLKKLVYAAEAIAQAKNIEVPNWKQQKQKILNAADEITRNWRSTEHADKTKKAFKMTAEVFQTLQQRGMFTELYYETNQLTDAASRIDPSVNMTNQPEAVRAYFQRAESLVNAMADRANLNSMSSR